MSNFRSWLRKKPSGEKEFLLRRLPSQFLKANRIQDLFLLLSNYEFIEAKINHTQFGIKALIEDYELINDIDVSHPDYSEQTITSLKLIQGALRLSTHILSQDPNQLAGQLSGRLLDCDTPDIQRLLQQIPQTNTTYLRSLTATLTPPTGRLLSTLIGHGDSVNAVAVTPDDTKVISGSSDHTVKVWNLNTGAEVLTLRGHTSPVNAVAVTPDGTRVISGASDNTVRVWNLATGTEIQRFDGHNHPVVAVAVTPDGKKVVSASIANYNSMKAWDLDTGEELTIKGHRDFVRTVAITSDNRLISGEQHRTIKVWDLTNGKIIFILRHRPETLYLHFLVTYFSMRLYVIAVTIDGKWLISGSGDKGKNMITIWNLETGEKTFTIKGHKTPICALAVTPDGKQIIYAAFNTIKIWDRESEKEICRFIAHDDVIYKITVTGDGNKIISASKDKTVKIWNLKSLEVNDKYLKLRDNKNSVNDVTITPDGKQAIFALDDQLIKVCNLEEKTIVSSFYTDHNFQDNLFIRFAHYHYIFMFNGLFRLIKRVVSIFLTKLTKKLSIFYEIILTIILIVRAIIIVVLAVLSLLLFPISFSIVIFYRVVQNFITFLLSLLLGLEKFENIGIFFKTELKIVKSIFISCFDFRNKNISKYAKHSDISENINYGNIINNFVNFLKESNCLARKTNIVEFLAIAPNNYLVFINQPKIGLYQLLTIWDYKTINKIYDLISIKQYCYIYLYLLISVICLLIPIYPFFLVRYLDLWDILEIFLLLPIISITYVMFYFFIILKYSPLIFHTFDDFTTAISITPDGKYVIAGSTISNIKVWNLETKKLCFVLESPYHQITSLAITPDGKYLVSGSKDKTIKLWNLETRKECFTLKGHGDSINTLSVTPDGKYAVSGSKDNTIKIWDLEKREEMFTFTGHTDSINRIKVTSNAKLVISASSDKTLQVWDFETREVIATFTGESAINCCAVAPDDVTIVAGDEGGNMHFLRLEGVGSGE